MWLHCGTGIDLDGDNLKDVFVCPISKMYIDEIKDDYHLFLRDSTRSDPRRVVYFFDGTGIDVQNNIYGTVDTNSWTIVDGQNFDWTDIKCEEKPINQITDIYQYLDELKNQSFII